VIKSAAGSVAPPSKAVDALSTSWRFHSLILLAYKSNSSRS
jgi:hypothetical protein